jgi:hypothetical protein
MRPDRDLSGHPSLSDGFTRKIGTSRPEDTGRRGSDDPQIVSRPLDLWIERTRRSTGSAHVLRALVHAGGSRYRSRIRCVIVILSQFYK